MTGDSFFNFTITELIPGKKIAWLSTDCNMPWYADKKVWAKTKLIFDLHEHKFKEGFNHRPMLASVDPEAFFAQLITAKPTAIMMVQSLLKDRYGYSVSYSSERPVITALTQSLSNHLLSNPEKTIATIQLRELHQFLVDLDAQHHSPEAT